MSRKKKRVDEVKKRISTPEPVALTGFDAEEFSIVELEDRLELGGCCNNNCDCKQNP